MKKSSITWIIGLAVLIIILLVVVFARVSPVNAPESNLQNASSSALGEGTSTNPFQSTSTPPANPSINSGIKGVVYLGPTCPVSQPNNPSCADKLFQTNLAVMTSDGKRVVANFSSDASGNFKVAVLPGQYIIQSPPSAPNFPRCTSNIFMVKANTYVTANVNCDSGIR